MNPTPADACGIKLTVKASSPRKAVARSSNPSHLLLLGSPPRRLERELASKGHRVEVASNAAEAKRKSYAVVMVVDSSQASEARSTFGDAVVVVRTGNVSADVTSVESQIARTPTKVDESRPVVVARTAKQPIAVGPEAAPGRELTAAKATEDVQPVREAPAVREAPPVRETPPVREAPAVREAPPAREAAPAKVATVDKRPAITTDAKPRSEVKANAGSIAQEIYFTTASASVGRTAAIARAARWLTSNPDVQVVIEGHADPRGNPDSNQALAQSRAESVRDQLVSAGIDASRLEVISYGDTRLKYDAQDRRNRRVAIEPKP